MKDNIKSFIEFYNDENKDAAFYLYLAAREKDPALRKKLKEIGEMEAAHARFWLTLLKKHGIKARSKKSHFHNRFYYFLRRVLGLKWLSQLLEIGENSAIEKYYKIYHTGELDEQEKEQLKNVIAEEMLHEDFFKTSMGDIQNNIRDIFLGMNDSLVEILAAVSGLTALKAASTHLIGLSGIIIGISGTLSMAIGTYISVKNQMEVKELGFFRLKVLYELFKKGSEPKQEIENPTRAALFTGFFYLLGTTLIVFPYFVFSNSIYALSTSLLAAILAWIVSGTIIAMSSGLSIAKKILEMILTGLGATIITFSLGTLFSGGEH